MTALVTRTDDGGVATLSLNRPEALNALSPALFVELRAHVEAIAATPDAIGCVILRGEDRHANGLLRKASDHRVAALMAIVRVLQAIPVQHSAGRLQVNEVESKHVTPEPSGEGIKCQWRWRITRLRPRSKYEFLLIGFDQTIGKRPLSSWDATPRR